MFNKLYENVKKYIKENIKILILLISLLSLFSIRLPFYIDAPGGLLDVETRIDIDTNNKVDGSFSLAYVKEFKATIPTLIYALISDEWDVFTKEEVEANESIEDIDYRNHLMLDEANMNAVIVAFDKTDNYYNITNRKLNVTYIYDEADTSLEIGDQILKVNGVNIESKKQLDEAIKASSDKLEIEVLNDNKIYQRFANKININNQKLIGIIITETKEIDTNIDYEFKFKPSESGPSGGFMMALSIYNYLTEKDITNGLKIVGTGTIDEYGNVGSIGGVKYKVLAANKENADIFFVPSDNYEEANDVVLDKKLDIKLIEVKTIDDAIKYLNNL